MDYDKIVKKLKIRNANKGRKDGAYTRIFGDPELGALISEVHATSISAGNILEKLINIQFNAEGRLVSKNAMKSRADLSQFLEMNKADDRYYSIEPQVFIKMEMIPTKLNVETGKTEKKKQDFYLLNPKTKKLILVEIKDGDTFDTKKSAGEKEAMDIAKKYFKEQPEISDYTITAKFCSFNASSKEMIKEHSKNVFPISECMTGKEFCEEFGVEKVSITKTREAANKDNIDFFKQRVDEILK